MYLVSFFLGGLDWWFGGQGVGFSLTPYNNEVGTWKKTKVNRSIRFGEVSNTSRRAPVQHRSSSLICHGTLHNRTFRHHPATASCYKHPVPRINIYIYMYIIKLCGNPRPHDNPEMSSHTPSPAPPTALTEARTPPAFSNRTLIHS